MSTKIKWEFSDDGETLMANGKPLLRISDLAYEETAEAIAELPTLIQEVLPLLKKLEGLAGGGSLNIRMRVEDVIEKLMPEGLKS